MTLKDILKYTPNNVNPEAKLIEANKWNESEKYNVRSTRKAVMVRTSDGDVWLPISAINTNECSGQQHYDRETGRYYHDCYSLRKDDEIIYSVRISMNYMQF